jgi:hypothetical protein
MHAPRPTVAVLLVAALFVGGCSGETDRDTETGSGPGSSASAAAPTGEQTVETSDGGEVVTSGELIDDFPAKKVPVIEGKILSSATSPDTGFNVVVAVEGNPRKVAKTVRRQLQKAGFQVITKNITDDGAAIAFKSAKFVVEMAATPIGPTKTSVNYVVRKR